MTIDEKLQHFYDSAVNEARQESDELLSKHKAQLSEQLAAHKQRKRNEAAQQIKAETNNAAREINKTLLAEQITLKRNWSQKQDLLKTDLFSNVEERLIAFTKTKHYDEYLYQKALLAKYFAGEDDLTVYLSPEDASKAEELEEKAHVPVEIAKESFLGGIKATIPHKNILIDDSFLTALNNEMKHYTFDGGLTNE